LAGVGQELVRSGEWGSRGAEGAGEQGSEGAGERRGRILVRNQQSAIRNHVEGEMNLGLAGKVAVITGGNTGIGLAIGDGCA